jgi:hypothetical protein
MKKLLAFFTLMLVMGAALFAGPVHINGPGTMPEFPIDAVSGFSAAVDPVTVSGYALFSAAHIKDIAGTITGDFREIISVIFSSESLPPNSPVLFTTPNIQRFYGAISQAQEVIPFPGSTRQVSENMVSITTV